VRTLAREPAPAVSAPHAIKAPASAPQQVARRPALRLARCGAGGCTCGGKCGGHGAEADEADLERLVVARAAIDAGGARALARAVAERRAAAPA
jgi:hypothetical protein